MHYALHKFHWKPHEFFDLPPREQAVIIASIQVKLENEKKVEREAKRKQMHRKGK